MCGRWCLMTIVSKSISVSSVDVKDSTSIYDIMLLLNTLNYILWW